MYHLTATKRIVIEPTEWLIVPTDSEENIDLPLYACIAIFAFKNGCPHLVAHANEQNPTKFKDAPESEKFISLREVLELHRRQSVDLESLIGVYVFSGMRTNGSDLGILNYLQSDKRYEIKGAGLNRPVRVRIKPSRGIIQFLNITGEWIIRPDYTIGQNYEINSRQ